MAKKQTGPKRAKGSTHLAGDGVRGLAGYAACGAYVLTTKQTHAHADVGCRECFRLVKLASPKVPA